jgi:hypothetical protein
LLGWQINCQWGYDPDILTEVELTFAPAEGGGTLVTLEHATWSASAPMPRATPFL